MRLLLLACLLLTTVGATAQDFEVRTIDFDLAENPAGGDVQVPFPQGVMFKVRVVNVVPGLIYRLIAPTESFERRRVSLLEGDDTSDSCGTVIRELKHQLSIATSEAEVRDIVRSGRARAEVECDGERLEEIDSWTTVTFKVGVLARGERFYFEVRRNISWKLTVYIDSESVASGPMYDESFAVVIGIDTYESSAWRRLSYAVKDATAMARFLTANGFEVIEPGTARVGRARGLLALYREPEPQPQISALEPSRVERLEADVGFIPMSFRRNPGSAAGRPRGARPKTLAHGSSGRLHPMPEGPRVRRAVPGLREARSPRGRPDGVSLLPPPTTDSSPRQRLISS